ncbi:hypothetical protein ANCDUO_21134, partial [Ancylostoma duodenale]
VWFKATYNGSQIVTTTQIAHFVRNPSLKRKPFVYNVCSTANIVSQTFYTGGVWTSGLDVFQRLLHLLDTVVHTA